MKRLLTVFTLGSIACSVSSSGLDPTSESASNDRLKVMQARQEQHRLRLAALDREIAASQEKAREAKLEADFQECRALRASIDADVAFERAQCSEAHADHRLCVADNEKKVGEHGFWGCVGGIAAAALSAGSAAPWALGGCGLGLFSGKAAEAPCHQPTCTLDRSQIEPNVIAQRGLREFPSCGGDPGFQVAALMHSANGAQVGAVGPKTTALAAGLAPGDTILKVGSRAIESCSELTKALDDYAFSEMTGGAPEVEITFVRDNQLFQGTAPLLKRNEKGKRSRNRQLGATCQGTLEVEYVAGTRIANVVPSGPADGTGLGPGDIILSVGQTSGSTHMTSNGETGLAPSAVTRALDRIRTGRTVHLTLKSGDETRNVEVVMGAKPAT